MSEPYFEIYEMRPIKQVEPDWWKLKWKPIWKGTLSVYSFPWDKHLGILARFNRIANGWGRSYNRFDLQIGLGFRTFYFWIKWNYIVHKNGPMDGGNPKPIFIRRSDEGKE